MSVVKVERYSSTRRPIPKSLFESNDSRSMLKQLRPHYPGCLGPKALICQVFSESLLFGGCFNTEAQTTSEPLRPSGWNQAARSHLPQRVQLECQYGITSQENIPPMVSEP